MPPFRLTIYGVLLTVAPLAPAQGPAFAAAMQDDCPVTCNPDGTCSADCSSSAPLPVPPPIPVPPPQEQCSSFPYRVVPPHGDRCAVTGSYFNEAGIRLHVLTCCG